MDPESRPEAARRPRSGYDRRAALEARLPSTRLNTLSAMSFAIFESRRLQRPIALDSAEHLRELYIGRRMSMAQIAEDLGCSTHPVRTALIRHGIAIRPKRQMNPEARATLADAEWCRQRYEVELRASTEIAAMLQTNTETVTAALKKHGIKIDQFRPSARAKMAASHRGMKDTARTRLSRSAGQKRRRRQERDDRIAEARAEVYLAIAFAHVVMLVHEVECADTRRLLEGQIDQIDTVDPLAMMRMLLVSARDHQQPFWAAWPTALKLMHGRGVLGGWQNALVEMEHCWEDAYVRNGHAVHLSRDLLIDRAEGVLLS